MRTLAIGDIHGCSVALDALLSAVAPAGDDRVVTLGDYVDWGPDARDAGAAAPPGLDLRLVPLCGNHEEVMLQAHDDPNWHAFWASIGGDATLASYGEAGVPDEHWDFLQDRCVDYFETDTHLFVHGGLDPNLPLGRQPLSLLRWQTFGDPRPHVSGKTMVCGHSEQRAGRPRNVGHAVCIDTAACRGGWLTCLDADTGDLWQATQRGEVRTAHLSDFRDVPRVSPSGGGPDL